MNQSSIIKITKKKWFDLIPESWWESEIAPTIDAASKPPECDWWPLSLKAPIKEAASIPCPYDECPYDDECDWPPSAKAPTIAVSIPFIWKI